MIAKQPPSQPRSLALVLCVTLGASAAPTAAASSADPDGQHWGYWPATDTSNWSCQRCPEAKVNQASVSLGIGYSDSESARLVPHSGVMGSGLYPLTGGSLLHVDEQSRFVALSGLDLGLQTRRVDLRAGERGRYVIALDFANIPSTVAEGPRTVFEGYGSSSLTLPKTWIRSPQTNDMSELDGSLQPIHLERRRETLGANIRLTQNRTLEYALNYRRIQEDGLRIHRGSFLTFATELPTDLNRVTDQIDARATYRHRTWTATGSYHLSALRNAADSITWDNPFSIGPERGRLALEPDNRFHQIMLSGSWRPGSKLATSGRIALGRMEQDAAFLPATTHLTLAPVILPSNSLDGQVDTLSGNIRMMFTVSPRVTLTGESYLNDHDNRTVRHPYPQIVMDTLPGAERINRPYSHQRLGGRALVHFRVAPSTTLAAGTSIEYMKRRLQEVDQTETTSTWGEIRHQVTDRLEARLRLTHDRRILEDPYETPADVSWVENPLMRKYHLADRNRDQLHVRLAYELSERIHIGLSVDSSRDEFPYSRIGLTNAQDRSYVLDFSATPREGILVSALIGRETVKSQLMGASSFAAPNWTANMQDEMNSLGLTVLASDRVRPRLDLGLDVLVFSGQGSIYMQSGSPTPELPDLRIRQQTLQLFGRYRISERFSMRIDYRYDRMRSRNYALDGVEPGILSEVLTLGQRSPSYTAQFVGGSLIYRF